MKFAPIPMYNGKYEPLKIQTAPSRFQMALTHLVLEDSTYANYYRQLSLNGHYVVLDNSIIELGDSMRFKDVLEAARRIQANEVILPDKLGDAQGTLQAIYQTLKDWNDHIVRRGLKVMAVAQGSTISELGEMVEVLSEEPAIDVIGIPKRVAHLHDQNSRVLVIDEMHKNGIFDKAIMEEKEVHLLGANGPHDFIYTWNGLVRSIDSVYPFWMAHHGIKLHSSWWCNKEARPEGKVFHRLQNVEDEDLALCNLAIVQGWAHNAD